MRIVRNYTASQETRNCALMLLVLFPFFPLIAIIALLLVNVTTPKIDKVVLSSLFICLALYLGLINATKEPTSDQWFYMQAYNEVPKVGFVRSLTNIYGTYFDRIHIVNVKEMGFGLVNYIGYYMTFGNYPLFVCLFTTVLYVILFYCIYLFFVGKMDAKTKILSGVFSIAFFTQFFNLTIHLQRQQIAIVVMMLALVMYVRKGRRNWFLIFSACLLHTSVILFVPFFLLGDLIRKASNRILILGMCMIAVVFISINSFGIFISNIIGDSYITSRMIHAGSSEENRMSIGLVLLLAVPMSTFSLYRLFFYKRESLRSEKVMYIIYISIIILVFTIPDNTLQYRYFMLSYVFIPFVFPQLFSTIKYSDLNIYLNIIIPCFLVLRFFFTFEDISFKYAPIENVLFSNAITLLFFRS